MVFNLENVEYIDIHSHLQFKSFDENREEIINRMNEVKVATICIGTDLLESEKGRDLALENENVFYSIGLHPHDNLEEFQEAINNSEAYFQKLKEVANHEKCLAVGECGLDYFYLYKDFASGKITEVELEKTKVLQKKVFIEQIKLAKELNIPLMLHIRPSELDNNKEDAYNEAIEILKDYLEVRGNFHFFVGTKKVLGSILETLPNFTVSIPAVCTFTNEYDEMIKATPLDKLQIETDSPFAMPKNKRKVAKQNEPSFVVEVFERICEIKGFQDEEYRENFRNILKENFQKMFLK